MFYLVYNTHPPIYMHTHMLHTLLLTHGLSLPLCDTTQPHFPKITNIVWVPSFAQGRGTKSQSQYPPKEVGMAMDPALVCCHADHPDSGQICPKDSYSLALSTKRSKAMSIFQWHGMSTPLNIHKK